MSAPNTVQKKPQLSIIVNPRRRFGLVNVSEDLERGIAHSVFGAQAANRPPPDSCGGTCGIKINPRCNKQKKIGARKIICPIDDVLAIWRMA